MKRNLHRPWKMRLVLGALGVAALCAAAAYFSGLRVLASNEHVHLATDWSHRHLIFSAPKTWWQGYKLSQNPRYAQQWLRRNAEKKNFDRRRPHRNAALKGDWSNYIGNNASAGPGVFPAKFSFDVTTASCANDFVVTGTNLPGSAGALAAFDNLTVATGATGSTITIRSADGLTTLTLTVGGANGNNGTNTGTWMINSDPTVEATNIAASINAVGDGNVVGVSATSNGAVVTLTAVAAGSAGNMIRLGGDVNGGGTGLTADNLNFQDGSSDTVSIAAFTDLYTGCVTDGLSEPQPAWAYNTGGRIKTSVSLSADGTQVAFVQTIAGVANLSVLKWAPGSSVGAGVDVTPVATASAYRTCTPTAVAPCLVNIPLSGGADDTYSSPFYDFASDAMYVGDDADNLHWFTGIFNGTPAEVTTAPWPVALPHDPGPGAVATSPVYDNSTEKIFIADGDQPDSFVGGYLYAVSATTGAVVRTSSLADFPGVLESPVVDSTNQDVYVFSSNEGDDLHSFVIEYSENFLADGAWIAFQRIGFHNTNAATIFSGNFDNAYYSGGAGNLYVCGNDPGSDTPTDPGTDTPTLYQIPVSSTGVMKDFDHDGPPNRGPALTTAVATCSPVTEFYNPTGGVSGAPADLIFLSVTGNGQTVGPINCPTNSGCIMSFDVTLGATITPSTATAATFSVPGGASGVVVDNGVAPGSGTSTSPSGTSEIYYTPLANGDCLTLTGIGGCLVQLSQATLR
jgi:hypothetical protein